MKVGEWNLRTVLTSLVLAIAISFFAWCLREGNPLVKEKSPASVLRVSQGEEVPFAVSAADIGTDDSTIAWDFGDGTPPVEERNPTHIYNKSGTYTVTIIAPDSDGRVRENKLVVIVEDDGSKTNPASDMRQDANSMWSRQEIPSVTGFTINENDSSLEIKPGIEVAVQSNMNPTKIERQAIAVPTNMQSKLARAQQILAFQIAKNPILIGTNVYIKDCSNNWQACAFYQAGIILIDPDHKASLEEIISHECNHIIDWRQDGDIDYYDYHN
jgi:hypothetical protein